MLAHSARFSARFLGLLAVAALATQIHAKPLKVYILCGQSNMEGHAQTSTFPAVAKDPKTKGLYDKMVGADGKAVTLDDVWIAYSYGNFSGDPVGKRSGKLTAGFGSQHHIGTGKIGPEFTFGITMRELQGEPILLIKDAWGGKSLMVDFRPPSAGEPEDEKQKEKAGVYYKLLIEHVREVLADPKAVYPDYNAKEGLELAGFVWFQGFNDFVGSYPRVDPGKGKKSVKDYSEYSRLLACFMRDVRKDLNAPKLPFVIGVMGVGGEAQNVGNTAAFRKAMAAPAETDEFKGSVANVFTGKYWPTELDSVEAKVTAVKKVFHKRGQQVKKMEGDERKQAQDQLRAEMAAAMDKAWSEEDKWLLKNGRSNAGFHYYGSAKFFAQTGQAFAEALVEMEK